MDNNKRKKTEIAFIILHYLAIEETYKCIQYIRENIDTPNYSIIVVDNASVNGTGALLKKEYNETEDVIVILNEENLGFAKGNNVGFIYAKKYLNPDFIVLMNNDIYLLEKDFKKKVQKEYEQSQFAVLGPLIVTKDGKCDVNPMREIPLSYEEVKHRKNVLKRFLKLEKVHMLGVYIWASTTAHAILNKRIEKKQSKNEKDFTTRKEDVQLHGCFLVFSQKYIEKFDGLDSRTFLYMEEDILFQHMLHNNMKTVYNPDIVVYHKEDAATDIALESKKKKSRMQYENELKSCEVLLQIQKEYRNIKEIHRE